MDTDEELEQLQRQLCEVQQEHVNQFSERTVAEIMVKLHHQNFPFHPTTDGNEYVTTSHLDSQIISLVSLRTKLNIGMLPQLLNVGLDAVESRMQSVATQGVTFHNRNLFSERYFEMLLQSVRQGLQLEGIMDLETVAVQTELSLTLLNRLISQHFKEQIHRNVLTTDAFSRLTEARVLGFLSAVGSPVSLVGIGKEVVVTTLLRMGKLKGKVESGYFIPERFSLSQKRALLRFYSDNGYLELSMVHKQSLLRPEEWLRDNIKGDYVVVEQVCFSLTQLEAYTTQMTLLLKEGFFQIGTVIPFHMEEDRLIKMLRDQCNLRDVVVTEGYCFAEEWLDKAADQFKERILYSVFFKKGKGAVTEEELIETLFNSNLADYSLAMSVAPILLPILIERLDALKKKLEKDLAQSKGVIGGQFLKYRSCRTVLRSDGAVQKMIASVEKLEKRGERWRDGDFGVTAADSKGLYSLVYYDAVIGKGWPSLQSLIWREVTQEQLDLPHQSSCYLSRNHLGTLMTILHAYESEEREIIRGKTIKTNSMSMFQFFVSEKESRRVMVDSMVPMVEGRDFASKGRYALAQKAHAKLRYCYRATLGVGIQQLIMELTGRTVKKTDTIEEVKLELGKGSLVIVMVEGSEDKVVHKVGSQVKSGKPYWFRKDQTLHGEVGKWDYQSLIENFRNIYVIQ